MHPIETMMKTTLEEIREMVDVNTIVGDAVHTNDGAVIIPISKVCFGFVSGGGEYGKNAMQPQQDAVQKPFAGGVGAGVSINPMAFVVVSSEQIRLLPVNYSSTLDRVIELFPQALCFAKDMIKACTCGEEGTSKKKKGASVQNAQQVQTSSGQETQTTYDLNDTL